MSELNGISRLQEEQQKTLKNCEEMIEKWEKFQEDYTAVDNLLNDLPKKTTHEVMVPVGPLAFMPGNLIHTNEIMVLLGDNWFAERSASQAVEIAKRRLKNVEEYLSNLRQEHTNILSHIAFTTDVANVKNQSDFKEIKEELSEKDKLRLAGQKHKRVAHSKATKDSVKKVDLKPLTKASISQPVKDKVLFSRLEELEKQETMNNEIADYKNILVKKTTLYNIEEQDEKPAPLDEKQSTKRVKWKEGVAQEKDKESVAFPKDGKATIKFTHSTEKVSLIEKHRNGITSPADIFNNYLDKKATSTKTLQETKQPRSILKNSNNNENKEKEKIPTEEGLPRSPKVVGAQAEKLKPAFADIVVVEHKEVPSFANSTNKGQNHETRTISKFKAGRMKK